MKIRKFVMRSAVLIVSAVGVLNANSSHASSWSFDDSHSAAEFSIRHLMITNVKGQVKGFKGNVELDDKDITKSKVEVTLEVSTINTDNEKRDEHLKSPDFFDVKKFPQMKFVSTKVEKAGEGLTVTGDLTMHGVTKSVVLAVEGPTAVIKDPWGKSKRGFSATTKVMRKDFGLVWNKNLDGGGVMLGEEVKISIDGELVEAKK